MPRRGVQPEYSDTPFWGSGVLEHKVEDFERLRLLLKNKCQNVSAVVGDVGEILAKLMEAFELHVNTRCGQSSGNLSPPPSIRSRFFRSPHPLPRGNDSWAEPACWVEKPFQG